jgi:hypothetical protein
VPNAPATPFGEATSAVGGTQHLDINQFTQNLLGNPNYAAAASGTAPGTASTPGTTYVPTPGGVAVAHPAAPVAPPAVPTTPTAVLATPPTSGAVAPTNVELDPVTGLPIGATTGQQTGAIAPVPA